MNIEEAARKFLNTKTDLFETVYLYDKAKKTNQTDYEFMLKAKHNLKNCQKMYWETKSVRENVYFQLIYTSSKELYEDLKNKYLLSCRILKTYKLSIKERQREISRYNRGLNE